MGAHTNLTQPPARPPPTLNNKQDSPRFKEFLRHDRSNVLHSHTDASFAADIHTLALTPESPCGG